MFDSVFFLVCFLFIFSCLFFLNVILQAIRELENGAKEIEDRIEEKNVSSVSTENATYDLVALKKEAMLQMASLRENASISLSQTER